MASTLERLYNAVRILDGGEGSARERLASAYRSEVQYIGPEGLDPTTAQELEVVNDELTKVEAEGDKDSIDMSVQGLSDRQVVDLSDQMRAVYDQLSERLEAAEGC